MIQKNPRSSLSPMGIVGNLFGDAFSGSGLGEEMEGIGKALGGVLAGSASMDHEFNITLPDGEEVEGEALNLTGGGKGFGLPVDRKKPGKNMGKVMNKIIRSNLKESGLGALFKNQSNQTLFPLGGDAPWLGKQLGKMLENQSNQTFNATVPFPLELDPGLAGPLGGLPLPSPSTSGSQVADTSVETVTSSQPDGTVCTSTLVWDNGKLQKNTTRCRKPVSSAHEIRRLQVEWPLDEESPWATPSEMDDVWVLGEAFLQHFVVTLDFEQSRIGFAKPAASNGLANMNHKIQIDEATVLKSPRGGGLHTALIFTGCSLAFAVPSLICFAFLKKSSWGHPAQQELRSFDRQSLDNDDTISTLSSRPGEDHPLVGP